jgi:hypothetical protein
MSLCAQSSLVAMLSAAALTGCQLASSASFAASPPSGTSAANFSILDATLPEPLVLIAYGDMRFTDPGETAATSPAARTALVNQVAAEHPAAIFLNGDVPWHGKATDYEAYGRETQVWREQALRVYPALGNHEFSQCEVAQCLGLWWTAFPELRGLRWYSVAIGSRVLGIALDSDTSLLPGSEQRQWLEQQLAALGKKVRFVLIVLHHPPVADVQTTKQVDHNPRPNESSLAAYLDAVAPTLQARILVSAGHIHNYERHEESGVTYLVSGGGGARPYEVDRTPSDLYQNTDFPNYHYVRLVLEGSRVRATMVRLGDPDAPGPHTWEVRDRFDISLRP